MTLCPEKLTKIHVFPNGFYAKRYIDSIAPRKYNRKAMGER